MVLLIRMVMMIIITTIIITTTIIVIVIIMIIIIHLLICLKLSKPARLHRRPPRGLLDAALLRLEASRFHRLVSVVLGCRIIRVRYLLGDCVVWEICRID